MFPKLNPASDMGNAQMHRANQMNARNNPELDKVTTADGMKHYYALCGKALGPAYPKRTHLQRELRRPAYFDRPRLGEEGDEGIVIEKNNPEATFCLKVRKSESLEKLFERIKITNGIAKLVASNELLRHHCVVEVFRKSKNDSDIYVARLIDGFTLEDYVNNPGHFPELDPESVKTKLQELKPVITNLFEGGYVNEDISSTNIMYDRSIENFVLIDFTRAKKTNDKEDLKFVLDEFEWECRNANRQLHALCVIM